MKKLLLLALLLPLAAYAQFGTARRVVTGATLPTSCGVGEVFFRTAGDIGFHECESENTWVFTRGAVGGSAFSAITTATNTTATMTCGTGCTITNSGSGVINSTTLAGTTPGAGGLAILDDASEAAIRTTLGLVIGTNVQAFDADLTTYAGITPSANIQTFLGAADYAAMRTQLSLVVGTNVQAFDAALTALAAGSDFVQFTGPTTSTKIFTLPNAAATILTDNAAVTVAQGGTGIASGTSGGVPYFSGSTTIASSAALTANLPVIGGGAGAAPSVGTRSGNTTQFVTTTGAQTSGRCVEIDANGNHIAAAGACGSGGTGDVVGPSSATDNAVARFDTTTGKLIQNSAVTIDDNGVVAAAGFTTSSGGAAGLHEYLQGTACTPSANTACYYAPTSITTAYGVVLPSAVGATGVVKVSVSGAVATLSHAALVDGDIPNDITIDLATLATTVTVADTTDSTSFCGLFESATGSLGAKTDAGCTYNASNGTLSATVLTEGANAVPNATDHLGFFAATTSAQLRGVLSDENGTGVALFDSASNPTLLDATINDLLTFAETAGDATCAAGDYWIKGNSTSNKLRGCENGTAFDVNTAGGSGVTSVDATGGVQTASGSPITTTGTVRGAWIAKAEVGTTYTVLTGDRGKALTFSNAGAVAVTLPQAGAGFEDGWFTIVKNIGDGDVTITPTTSTISGASSIVLSTGEDAFIRSDGTNYEALSNRMLAGAGVALAKTRTALTPSLSLITLTDNQSIWDGANASRTLTANLSGATDPVITFANDLISFSSVIALQSGTAPTVDAVGEIAFDTNHWGAGEGTFIGHSGTAGVAFVGIRTSDTCLNGQVPKFATGGIWTCEADATGGTAAWDTLTAPTGATSFVSDATAETITFSFESAFSTGNQFLIRQQTGNPTAGTLFAVTAADADIVLSLFQRAIDGSAVLSTFENSQSAAGASTNEAADLRFLFGGAEAGLLRWGKTEDYTSGANESSFFAIRTRTDGTTAEAARFLLNGVLDVVTGFRIGGAAASNAVLAGNGTNFVATTPAGGGAPLGAGRALTGGAGIAALGDLTADRTIATASGETDFLASGALTCGASTQGRMQVHTTPLQYCDNAATPALQYAAYGDSAGAALSGDSATSFFSTGTIENARLDSDLGALGDNSTNGLWARTGAGTGAARTFQSSSGGALTWTNGDGVSGNPTPVLTTTSKIWLAAASCQGTTGALLWDTIATQQPTATCTAGTTETNLIRGVADFLDTGTAQMQIPIQLPADFTGAIDVTGKWRTTVTTNNVFWQISTVCRADAEVDDAAFNTASTVADTAKGTANQLNDFSITGITATGCAAGELMHLRILRDPAHASDTLAATASLVGLEVTLRRAQ